MSENNDIPEIAKNAVLVNSQELPKDSVEVAGYDFDTGEVNFSDLLNHYYHRMGYQATQVGQAIKQINDMIEYRDEENGEKCKIYLGYTSNLVSSGLRDIFKYLAKNRMVDVIVSTAGGIEEDFIKCLAPTYVLGSFRHSGSDLRSRGLNRIGNLVVPNDNYCKFEDWILPILDKMLEEQKSQGVNWTPSKVIKRLGKEIDHPDSIYYWCYKNDIDVFCPAITDGSLGDMIYFHSFKNPGLIIDLVQDIRNINGTAVYAKKTGVVILGGGLVKHHICNANLMRNGSDFAVYINTGQEFDGSDAGAHPDEAVSWGKIRSSAKPVKISADATIVFPLIVAETFAKKR